MEFSNAFKAAVAEGNVRRIRIMLKDSLLVDPTFERFNEMERVASSVKGLYDAHDGRAFEENPELWNDAYMNKIMVQVVGNFSDERVNHLKKVVHQLRPALKKMKISDSGSNTQNLSSFNRSEKPTYQVQKHQDQMSGDYLGTKIAAGAVAGGVVGGIVGTAASLTTIAVVGCVGVGATIGAAAVYYGTNERN